MGRSGKERKKEEKKSDPSSRWVDFNSGYIQKSPRELSVLIFPEDNSHQEKSPDHQCTRWYIVSFTQHYVCYFSMLCIILVYTFSLFIVL